MSQDQREIHVHVNKSSGWNNVFIIILLCVIVALLFPQEMQKAFNRLTNQVVFTETSTHASNTAIETAPEQIPEVQVTTETLRRGPEATASWAEIRDAITDPELNVLTAALNNPGVALSHTSQGCRRLQALTPQDANSTNINDSVLVRSMMNGSVKYKGQNAKGELIVKDGYGIIEINLQGKTCTLTYHQAN